jgi:hypothetical protein
MVVITAFMPERAEAYGGSCHDYLASHAAPIFSFPELDIFMPSVIDGANHEDEFDHIYDTSGVWKTIPHFWKADEGDDQLNQWGAYYYENAWMKAQLLLGEALTEYQLYRESGAFDNILWAYHYLGHVSHLVQDMGVPAHAHYDEHADDSYENWMAGDGTEEPAGCGNWNEDDAMAKYGDDVELSSSLLADISTSILGQPVSNFSQLYASLYYAMYKTNQISDYFASDGSDGNPWDRHGWVDYSSFPPNSPVTEEDLEDNDENPDNDDDGQLSIIAEHSYLHAMWATAVLYRAWRDYLDPVPPTTEISVSGGPIGQDNWRAGDVEITLTAFDNPDGSGVHETRWGFNSTESPPPAPYTDPIVINGEGVHSITYASMDIFANWEDTKEEEIKIDKTPPEVSVISPIPDGLYLTSGMLTLDFDATDAMSGIHSMGAELSGIPVADGDVFDLDTMAGHYTLTVTAIDMAGNSTSESVDFSVKIHANVDVKPDILNVKSQGQSVVAYIEFPSGYDVAGIAVPTVVLTINGLDVSGELSPNALGDYDRDGEIDLMVQFDRDASIAALAGMIGNLDVVVSGELDDATEFYGSDPVEVFRPGLGPQ